MVTPAICPISAKLDKREALRKDLIQAWNDYQTTGLYADAEEVEEWIAGWGTENELPVPECRA
ncbi:MAG: hypothetical protein FWG71_02180 [Synergistaceae bacterium]|nr:hypothetical protein [Synergistaceae bacterium]